ncbi:hypothetical protein [Acinetobacter gerneri]|uniref:hypothetical protein n=1 Tax=Acinetobacter gerneri TaxID=202952 RepID=UPI003214116F
MKQLILLSLIGISLTGCILAPYDDGNHRHHHDRSDSDRRYSDRNDSDRRYSDRNRYQRTTIIEQPGYSQPRRPW